MGGELDLAHLLYTMKLHRQSGSANSVGEFLITKKSFPEKD